MRAFLFALLLVTVSALRRGPASPTHKQWYPTPYGWGFENIPDRPEGEPAKQEVSKMQEKAIKEVKRAKVVPKPEATNHFGVSSKDHPMWRFPEEVLDGFE